MRQVVISGSFDNLQSREMRFLDQASQLGDVTALVWPDETVQAVTGQAPRFPLEERLYFLQGIRYVRRALPVANWRDPDELPHMVGLDPDVWVVDEHSATSDKRLYCASFGLGYQVIREQELAGWPELPEPPASANGRKKVIVTGCFDWLHSGHVRFFEEVSAYGKLYVAIGHDENLRLLKGPGHPQFPQDERRYMVQAIRYVYRALVTSGSGWMDAAPEIERLKPDIYAVNEDGDKPEKRAFCAEHGLEYLVLKRLPKPGLPARQSTDLRGF